MWTSIKVYCRCVRVTEYVHHAASGCVYTCIEKVVCIVVIFIVWHEISILLPNFIVDWNELHCDTSCRCLYNLSYSNVQSRDPHYWLLVVMAQLQ